jgi:hypothetical protein
MSRNYGRIFGIIVETLSDEMLPPCVAECRLIHVLTGCVCNWRAVIRPLVRLQLLEQKSKESAVRKQRFMLHSLMPVSGGVCSRVHRDEAKTENRPVYRPSVAQTVLHEPDSDFMSAIGTGSGGKTPRCRPRWITAAVQSSPDSPKLASKSNAEDFVIGDSDTGTRWAVLKRHWGGAC